ncbi:ATP-binding protein, partial [Amnibacterium sp.]|uniref:ATP-binding protein n=1 Tax=Amnibacterium sp. TaxID=1872496 RepID=UPI0039C8AE87
DGTSGSGIGLTLVRALVRSAGGEVTLANRRDGGAEAVVRLPIVDAEPPAIV